MKLPIWIRASSFITILLVSCSPAGWADVKSAAGVAATAVDTFAIMRADAIRAKGDEAAKAAEKGDTLGSMRALNEALAEVATKSLDELAITRAELAKARAACQVTAPTTTATAPPVATSGSPIAAPSAAHTTTAPSSSPTPVLTSAPTSSEPAPPAPAVTP